MAPFITAALVLLSILGLVSGIVLAVASRIFHVKIDERIQKIHAVLPGANCGGCGFPGCQGYAEAIIMADADPTLCTPGGKECVEQVAEILGIEVSAGTVRYPIVRCQGREAKVTFEYNGIETCKAASLVQNGFKACSAGCLGLGDCAAVCPVDAIVITDGIPVINEEKCISCGKCVKACPRSIIELRPENDFVHVLCMNHDKGKTAKDACPASCIGCKKCEKECPFDAIHVTDFLAEIDYEKCKNCGKCVGVCPNSVIVNLRKERKARQKMKQAGNIPEETTEKKEEQVANES